MNHVLASLAKVVLLRDMEQRVSRKRRIQMEEAIIIAIGSISYGLLRLSSAGCRQETLRRLTLVGLLPYCISLFLSSTVSVAVYLLVVWHTPMNAEFPFLNFVYSILIKLNGWSAVVLTVTGIISCGCQPLFLCRSLPQMLKVWIVANTLVTSAIVWHLSTFYLLPRVY